MLHRSTLGNNVTRPASQPAVLERAANVLRNVLAAAQHTLTLFGLSAVAAIALLAAKPELAKQVSQFLTQDQVQEAPALAPDLAALMEQPAVEADSAPTAEEKALLGSRKQQQAVTSWLSKRYRVASDATNMLVSTAYLTAHETKMDPLLILAVMAIESGLNPFAESPMGAQGLMQVMSKVHQDKFEEMGGVQAALNPVANIRVGAQILKEYVRRSGSIEAGLKNYVGAGAAESDAGYSASVLAEYNRLKQVAGGKSVPVTIPKAVAPVEKEPKTETARQTAKSEQLAGL
ncbi:lytic transglycosylase domain-containing protein [Massilia sp. TS11]|uniref:lytic transglycosylase domain-containing protein n=1 Tax=Massilia sp. TS11 TaxID=2908003 RepID=UPI001EDBD885|nr:lytic transglycosylase domain-containing protein [Massilia sp. TS11]MCG2586128.1 lytic transglycosylase domain-containing protein [Massilia sp. TS11]